MVVSGHMGMDYDKPLPKILMKQLMGKCPSFLLGIPGEMVFNLTSMLFKRVVEPPTR